MSEAVVLLSAYSASWNNFEQIVSYLPGVAAAHSQIESHRFDLGICFGFGDNLPTLVTAALLIL